MRSSSASAASTASARNTSCRRSTSRFKDTVELRVREVLEEKLAKILEEFGVDKLADVLDSEEGGPDFEDLYVEAMRQPDKAVERAETLAAALREARARGTRRWTKKVLRPSPDALTPKPPSAVGTSGSVLDRAYDRWATWEYAGAIRRARRADYVGYQLRWPDGTELVRGDFAPTKAPALAALTLEDPHVRCIAAQLGFSPPGSPIPSILVPDISDKVTVSGRCGASRSTAEAPRSQDSAAFLEQ